MALLHEDFDASLDGTFPFAFDIKTIRNTMTHFCLTHSSLLLKVSCTGKDAERIYMRVHWKVTMNKWFNAGVGGPQRQKIWKAPSVNTYLYSQRVPFMTLPLFERRQLYWGWWANWQVPIKPKSVLCKKRRGRILEPIQSWTCCSSSCKIMGLVWKSMTCKVVLDVPVVEYQNVRNISEQLL